MHLKWRNVLPELSTDGAIERITKRIENELDPDDLLGPQM